MRKINRSSRVGTRKPWRRTVESLTYQAVVDQLISEVERLIRSTELRKFSPPFKLVIIGNRGCVAFSGQVDQDGKMQPAGPLRKLRRSDFPANALITDQSLAIRTFRIDCTGA